MKIRLVLFFILFFSTNLLSFSVLINNTDTTYSDLNSVEDNSILIESGSLTDSTISDTSLNSIFPLRISQNSFMYADNFRYTINGNLPLTETEIEPLRFGLFAGALTGFMVGQHIYQVNTIWAESANFRFIEDGDYALYSDKIGHFYGAYFSGYVYTEMLMWSGFSKESAAITGAVMGVAYSTYVEIMDGYAANWGFSPSDFYSDIAGFGFLLLQHYAPWFQNITPKFMYIPAEWHGEKRRSPSEFFIDDYSSQTLYLSLNLYNILPENLKQYWLPWLQLTVGYAARNLSNPSDPNSVYLPEYSTKYNDFLAGSPRFIIGLDYDLVKLMPDGPPIWNWLKQTMNYLKFPAPAIEISERGTKFMLMYPFLAF